MYIVILIRGIKEKKMIFHWWLVYIFLEALNSIKVRGMKSAPTAKWVTWPMPTEVSTV